MCGFTYKCFILIILIGLICTCAFALQDSDKNENDSEKSLSSRNSAQIEKQILNTILNDYDKRIRPSGVNNSDEVQVRVNIYIRNIYNLDEDNDELSLQIIFRQEWQDSRLAFEQLKTGLPYMPLTDLEQIWIPDVFFSNEKQSHAHQLLKPNHYMRIFPDGRILYSARLSLDLDCQFDLINYPFDSQTCFIKIASYGFTKDQIEFKWKDESPIQKSDRLDLDEFEIGEFTTTTCDSSASTGTYSCLRIDLNFERSIDTLMAEMYIPSIAIVMFSWTSFWLLPIATAARSSIGILANVAVSLIVDLKLTFSSPFHCWGTSCILFVIAAFLEFCTANFISQNEDDQPEIQEKKGPWFCPYPNKNSQRIDFFARIIFPLAFILFNIVYWLLNV